MCRDMRRGFGGLTFALQALVSTSRGDCDGASQRSKHVYAECSNRGPGGASPSSQTSPSWDTSRQSKAAVLEQDAAEAAPTDHLVDNFDSVFSKCTELPQTSMRSNAGPLLQSATAPVESKQTGSCRHRGAERAGDAISHSSSGAGAVQSSTGCDPPPHGGPPQWSLPHDCSPGSDATEHSVALVEAFVAAGSTGGQQDGSSGAFDIQHAADIDSASGGPVSVAGSFGTNAASTSSNLIVHSSTKSANVSRWSSGAHSGQRSHPNIRLSPSGSCAGSDEAVVEHSREPASVPVCADAVAASTSMQREPTGSHSGTAKPASAERSGSKCATAALNSECSNSDLQGQSEPAQGESVVGMGHSNGGTSRHHGSSGVAPSNVSYAAGSFSAVNDTGGVACVSIDRAGSASCGSAPAAAASIGHPVGNVDTARISIERAGSDSGSAVAQPGSRQVGTIAAASYDQGGACATVDDLTDGSRDGAELHGVERQVGVSGSDSLVSKSTELALTSEPSAAGPLLQGDIAKGKQTGSREDSSAERAGVAVRHGCSGAGTAQSSTDHDPLPHGCLSYASLGGVAAEHGLGIVKEVVASGSTEEQHRGSIGEIMQHAADAHSGLGGPAAVPASYSSHAERGDSSRVVRDGTDFADDAHWSGSRGGGRRGQPDNGEVVQSGIVAKLGQSNGGANGHHSSADDATSGVRNAVGSFLAVNDTDDPARISTERAGSGSGTAVAEPGSLPVSEIAAASNVHVGVLETADSLTDGSIDRAEPHGAKTQVGAGGSEAGGGAGSSCSAGASAYAQTSPTLSAVPHTADVTDQVTAGSALADTSLDAAQAPLQVPAGVPAADQAATHVDKARSRVHNARVFSPVDELGGQIDGEAAEQPMHVRFAICTVASQVCTLHLAILSRIFPGIRHRLVQMLVCVSTRRYK